MKEFFVGREDIVDSFKNEYLSLEKSMPSAVVYYWGVGGIGKTTLVNNLYNDVINLDVDAIFYSFKQDIRPSKVSVLMSLSQLLAERYPNEFCFPYFFTALSIYYNKLLGKNIYSFNKKVSSLSERYPLIGDALNIVSNLGVSGLATASAISIFDHIVAGTINKIKDKANTDYKEKLKDLDACSSEQIGNILEKYFIIDMQISMDRNGRQLFIFLDTYEIMAELVLSNSDYCNDDWLRNSVNSVFNSIKNVVWVISGRNELEWKKEYCQNFIIESVELKEIDSTSTNLFFEKMGIEDIILRGDLVELTKGMPLFMSLCVDRYLEIQEIGGVPTIKTLGNDLSSLTIRYLKNMNPITLDIAYFLAVLEKWTDEEVFAIADRMKNVLAFSIPSYFCIIANSFITTDGNNRKYMHDVVRKTIYDYLKNNTGYICIEAIWSALFSELINKMIEDNNHFKEYLDLCNYYARKCKEEGKNVCDYINELSFFIKLIMEWCEKEWAKEGNSEQEKYILELLNLYYDQADNIEFRTFLLSRAICELRHAGKYNKSIQLATEHLNDYNIEINEIKIELAFSYCYNCESQMAIDIASGILVDEIQDIKTKIKLGYLNMNMSRYSNDNQRFINELYTIYQLTCELYGNESKEAIRVEGELNNAGFGLNEDSKLFLEKWDKIDAIEAKAKLKKQRNDLLYNLMVKCNEEYNCGNEYVGLQIEANFYDAHMDIFDDELDEINKICETIILRLKRLRRDNIEIYYSRPIFQMRNTLIIGLLKQEKIKPAKINAMQNYNISVQYEGVEGETTLRSRLILAICKYRDMEDKAPVNEIEDIIRICDKKKNDFDMIALKKEASRVLNIMKKKL